MQYINIYLYISENYFIYIHSEHLFIYIYVWLTVFVLFTDRECNPGFLGLISGNDADAKNRVAFDKESIIGLIIWFSCVLYSSLRTASKSSKITMSENILVQDNGAGT